PTSPPWDSLPRLHVLPLPRNMCPEAHSPRREDRVKRLTKQGEPPDTDLYFTDASYYPDRCRTAVTNNTYSHTTLHEGVPSPTAAETLAIAEAIIIPTHHHDQILIRTDSQGACRQFRDNTLPPHIHALIQQHLTTHPHLNVTIQWIP
ncbi:unnamed protein product, partial [Ixodes pacificus]